ncbi:MAG: YcxB family protein [Beijerinckiaceae bacterium]|nr:YcxB family protein [Beijerinckiaceae bacterium]
MPEPVPTPLRRFVFKLTRADYEASLKRFDNRPVSLSLIFSCAIAVGFIWGWIDPGWFGELALLPIIAGAAVILYGLVHVWRRVRRKRRVQRWTPPALPIELDEYADRLVVRENGQLRTFVWDDILSISMDDARVYIVESRENFVVAPLEAFASHDAMRAFVLTCQERMREPAEKDEPAETAASRDVSALVTVALPVATEIRDGVDVTLTQNDARDAEAALRQSGLSAPLRLSTAAVLIGVLGGIIAGAPVWALSAGQTADARLSAAALAAWLGALLLTFLGARRIESARAAQWPANDPRRMTRRFEIDEAGFVTRGAEFETRIAWMGVESIRATEQHILFITRWKEVYAVPKRCFTNADAGHAFEMKARAFKTAS